MLLEILENLYKTPQYIQNIWLIVIFSISFVFFKVYFKNEISSEEQVQRQTMAESYLNKHKNSDCDFFFGNDINETTPRRVD